MREAVDQMNANGEKANLLHFTDVWPLPVDKVRPLLESTRHLVGVESNATGQLAMFLQTYAGKAVDHKILRYDGRPLSPEYILSKL
jgi:2-oxoglutarate ferredoxin oxidoreductase subunit alpha